MSTKQVDERVVSMEFDNKLFEKNVSTSLTTIEKLKKSLNLNESAKNLQNLTTAANKCDLSGIGKGVDVLQAKFSAFQVMAVTTLANITNQAVNFGKRMTHALTIEPIKMGFQEYETQINAVQTILANTQSKGTTLDNVNAALDELNRYADMTIYNFTEMTRNIGTFTAAGVDLDTSVSAIKGIANLAAVSGSTSQQASTAMYQLSQALASGTVKLMDWNSVVNAGMGGQVFQDALKETARVHGINIDAMIKKEGSFRETLKDGWLTSSILTETLAKFTGDMNAEQLKSIGYTDEQIKEILKLGQTANDAATKVKTFTQLVDTLKEAAQSGWTQTWEILVGDFEEAKAMWTSVSDVIGKVIGDSANVRNSMLQGWADAGGREKALESIKNIFEGLVSVIKPVNEAFREIFPHTTSKQLLGITEGILKLTEKFKIGETTANNLKTTFKGVFALIDIGAKAVTALFKGFSKLVGYILPVGDGFLGITAGIGEFVIKLNEALESSDAFNKIVENIGKFLKPLGDGIKEGGSAIKDSLGETMDNASVRLMPLSEMLKTFFDIMAQAMEKVIPVFTAIATKIGEAFGAIRDAVASLVSDGDYSKFFDLINGSISVGIGVGILRFVKNIGDATKDASGFLGNITDILEGVGDAINAFTGSIKAHTLKTIATSIAILAGALLVLALIPSEKLTVSLAAIASLFVQLMGAMTVLTKSVSGVKLKGMYQVASMLTTISTSLLILAGAMKLMSTMSWEELAVGLTGITVGLGVLIGAIKLLPEKGVNKATKSITKISGALIVLGVAIKIMGSMSWGEMAVGLTGMAVGLGAIVGAMHLLPKDMKSKTTGMIAMATSLVILAGAIKMMGYMSWEEIGRGLTAMAGGLLAMSVAMKVLPKGSASKATGVLIMAGAMVALGKAITDMGSMSWEEIGRGITVLAGSLLILATAMSLMSGGLAGAAAMLVMSGALAVFVPILKSLGEMSWDSINKGLMALAGAFLIIGVAGMALAPIVPSILALAGAAALLGVACLAVGAGVLAFSVGLTALAAAGAGAAVGITAIVSSLIGLIPYFIEQVGVGIVKLCEVIAGSKEAVLKAITVIVTSIAEAIVTCVPTLVDGVLTLIDSLLEAIKTYMPSISSKLIDIIILALEQATTAIPRLVGSVVTFLAALIDAVASNVSVLIDPIVNLLVNIFQGVADAIGPIVDIIVNALSGLLEKIAPVIEQIANLVEKVGEAFENIFNGIADVVRSVGDSIKSVLDGIAGVIDSIGEAALNAGTGFENLANGVKTITDLKLADMAASLGAVATGIGKIAKHSSELAEAGEGMKNIASGTTLTQSAFDNIASNIEMVIQKLLSVGPNSNKATKALEAAFSKSAALLTAMRKSVDGDTTKIVNSITRMCTNCINAINSLIYQFKISGRNAVIGFANGISENTYLATAKARAMANAAANAARNALDEHSPSRVFYEIGDFAGIALINALADNVSKVGKAGKALGTASIDGVRTVISKIADVFNGDLNAQPTIRPVLDLSNIESGVGAIGNMLNGNTLAYSTRLAGTVSTSAIRNQNRGNNEVISAIKDLGRMLSESPSNVYNVNGVNVDESSAVSSAVNDLIRALRMEGRV